MHDILIVDDEKGIAKGLEMIIKRNMPGCRVAGLGYNGIEGFNLATRLNPDIILTDIRMPQADGLEMVKRLKEEGSKAKVIILSGYSDFEYAKKGIALGVKFYINKPVEEEELFDCIRKAAAEIDEENARALELQHLRELYQKGMQHTEENEENPVRGLVVSAEELAKLENSIEIMDLDACNDAISEIADKVISNKTLSLSEKKLQCLGILLSVISKIPNGQFQLNEFLGRDILSPEAISRFENEEQIRNWWTNTFHSIIELKSDHGRPVKKDTITEIKEFVYANFDKDISLSELSGRFFMNPSYLSQLFKEKTGDTYLNYVMKLRISKAKELLNTSDLKIYEICEMVGYTDTNYFSKLFEKLVGCRPSEYKRKSSQT